jgi:hypothetical protein
MIETDGVANFMSECVPQIINIDIPIETDFPAGSWAETNVGLLDCD